MTQRLSRRAVMTGGGASALALSGAGFTQRQTLAQGTVFEDRGGSGRRRAGDPGIAGVMVSNGREVVLSDADGAWQLPIEPGDSVFVIKPPHWMTPLRPGGIPQFSATASSAVDFPLTRQGEAQEFAAILVTDTQPENALELDYVRDDIIAGMLGRNAAFGINHGDVVADNLALYPRYLDVLGATGIPWHHCAGNHDIDRGAEDDALSRETWKRTFGARHYAFQYAGATFLILDNVEYFGRASGRYRGRFGPSQLAFVRNVLRHVPREHLVVLSMHIPLRCYLDPTNPADTTADYRELLGLLSDRPHSVSFAGHLHATEHHYLVDDAGLAGVRPHHHHVLTAGSGSWWSGKRDFRGIPSADSCDGTPNGFHMLMVDGHRYVTEFVPAIARPISQLRVALDGPHRRAGPVGSSSGPERNRAGFSVPAGALGGSSVVANVFDGGPRTHVTCEFIGQTPPLTMQQAAIRDPLVVDLFEGDAPRKDWVQPVTSSHIWTLTLPATLAAGAHRIVVRAIDEYGRLHEARAVVEVTDQGHAPA